MVSRTKLRFQNVLLLLFYLLFFILYTLTKYLKNYNKQLTVIRRQAHSNLIKSYDFFKHIEVKRNFYKNALKWANLISPLLYKITLLNGDKND